MIWEFIKDSPAWRTAGWSSIIYAAAWLLLAQGNDTGVAAGAPILIYLGHLLAVVRTPDTAFRCTFFDAALPIGGRQLWISKMIVLLGMLWLPVLAASAVGFAMMNNPALPFLDAAAGYTVILLFAQCFRIREFNEPVRVCVISLIVGGAAIVVLGVALPDSRTRLLAVYLLISAALFLISCARVPKAFQAAPVEMGAAVKPAVSSTSAGVLQVWWKIFRPICGWQTLVCAPVVWISGGSTLLVILGFAPPVIAMVKQSWLFLAHLPLSRRRLFCAIWAPLPVSILAGYEAGIHVSLNRPIPPLEPRILAIVFAIGVALFLIWIFFLESFDWRRLRSLPAALRIAFVAIFPIIVGAAWILVPTNEAWHSLGNDPIPYYAIELSSVLPANPLLLILTLTIPVAALYWLAEKAFREMELTSTGKPPAQAYLQP